MRRILGRYLPSYRLVFRSLEALLIGAGCCAFFYFRFGDAASPFGVAAFAAVLSVGVVCLMHSGGLYAEDALHDFNRALWRLSLLTVPIFALAVWTTGELAKHTSVPIYPYRWQWTGALTAAWLALAVFLRLCLQQVHRSGALVRRIIVIGQPEQIAELHLLERDRTGRFEIAAEYETRASELHSVLPENLLQIAAKLRVSEIVVAIGSESIPWPRLVQCRLSGIQVTRYVDFAERESRRVRVEDVREDWFALSRGLESTALRGAGRRLLDLVLAAIGIAATAPVLALAAIAIKLEDGGSVLYRQERVGFRNRTFMLLKFRSMRENAESDGTPAWTSVRDDRITAVGRVIRKLRIDELPQFWNVLKGEMSLIGPRPERPYFVCQFSGTIPFYDYRHVIRPGITGWAQVSFRYSASLEDTQRKLSYDLYYIKNRSLGLDALILLRTIGVVLRGTGAR